MSDPSERVSVLKRLNYGAVVLIAYVFLFSGSFAFVAHDTAGPGYAFVANAAKRAVCLGAVSPWFGPALTIWLGLTWIVSLRIPLWRSRAWIAIAPPLAFLIYRVALLVGDPPSPQKYFHETFEVSLPADARVIEVAHPTFADPGYVDFALICRKESVDDLIARMGLDLVTNGSRPPFSHFRVGGQWNWHEWTTPYQFAKTQRTGVGHILVADADKERVLVARDPLFAKPEAEFLQGVDKE